MATKKNEVQTEAAVEVTLEALMETHKTKSAVIRHLASEGMEKGKIAKFMGIRYQHVRNVLITPLKKTASE